MTITEHHLAVALAQGPYVAMADLNLMIERGWGDTPQNQLPPDWRERMGPDGRRGRKPGQVFDVDRKRARQELVILQMRAKREAKTRMLVPREFAKPRLSRHWTDRRAAYLAGKLSA